MSESTGTSKRDFLRGLKENVIIGKLIPAGSGYDARFGKHSALNGVDEANLEMSVQARPGVAVAEVDQATAADLRELMEAGLVPGSGGIDFGDDSGYTIETPEEEGV